MKFKHDQKSSGRVWHVFDRILADRTQGRELIFIALYLEILLLCNFDTSVALT